jgi:hypothetical protein
MKRLAVLMLLWPLTLCAADFSQTYLKVVSPSAPVRSGPGGSYPQIGTVAVDEILDPLDRTADGSWWRVRLTRGSSGWIFSDLVWPFQVVDESALGRTTGWLERTFSGGQLQDGRFMLGISAGTLGSDALFGLRLGWLSSDYTLWEMTISQSAGRYGNIFCAGGELLFLFGSWRALLPFLAGGAALARFSPHRQAEVFTSGNHLVTGAGGGLMLQVKKLLVLRFDARRLIMLGGAADWSGLNLSGGLMLVY